MFQLSRARGAEDVQEKHAGQALEGEDLMHLSARKWVLTVIASMVLLLLPAGVALAWTDVGTDDLEAYGLTQADLEGMSQGYPDGTWKPYDSMSRGQFIKMAVEAWDVPSANPEIPSYVDVPEDNVFYEYIETGTAAGLVNGKGDNQFDPFGPLTREQAAAIIARWMAGTDGYDLPTYFTATEIDALLDRFGDGAQVSASLKEEVSFAVDWKIMRGSTDGLLTPHAGLLRIQGAALLVRGTQQAAANGLTADSITVGMGGATGSFSGDEEDLGFQLAFQEASDNGGVHGREVKFISYPGAVTTADKVANAKKLIEEDQVFGIVNFGGMPLALALAPYVQEKQIPYLFPHTGAGAIHGLRYVFPSFPYYEDECRYMLKYLVNELGYQRLAIAYADNAYGYLFRDALRAESEALGYEVSAEQAIEDMNPTTLATEVTALRDSGAEAVIMALYVEQAQKLLEEKGAIGWDDVQLVSTGPLTDADTLDVPGGYGEGTIGLSFYPDAATSQEPGIVAFREVMEEYHPGKVVNNYSLYGYVYGKLILAGLEAAGSNVNRERFIDAMEGLDNWSSGGIMPPVSLSPSNHHAQPWAFVVELRDGILSALTDWINTAE